jgi:hypothetical protein
MAGEYSTLNQRLSKLSKQTTAQAIIILRRKQILASTGSLSYPAMQEVVDLIYSLSKTSLQYLQKPVCSWKNKNK